MVFTGYAIANEFIKEHKFTAYKCTLNLFFNTKSDKGYCVLQVANEESLKEHKRKHEARAYPCDQERK